MGLSERKIRIEWPYLPSPLLIASLLWFFWRMGEELLFNHTWHCGRLHCFPTFLGSLYATVSSPTSLWEIISHLTDVKLGHVSFHDQWNFSEYNKSRGCKSCRICFDLLHFCYLPWGANTLSSNCLKNDDNKWEKYKLNWNLIYSLN